MAANASATNNSDRIVISFTISCCSSHDCLPLLGQPCMLSFSAWGQLAAPRVALAKSFEPGSRALSGCQLPGSSRLGDRSNNPYSIAYARPSRRRGKPPRRSGLCHPNSNCGSAQLAAECIYTVRISTHSDSIPLSPGPSSRMISGFASTSIRPCRTGLRYSVERGGRRPSSEVHPPHLRAVVLHPRIPCSTRSDRQEGTTLFLRRDTPAYK
jgi:hypothetical protein